MASACGWRSELQRTTSGPVPLRFVNALRGNCAVRQSNVTPAACMAVHGVLRLIVDFPHISKESMARFPPLLMISVTVAFAGIDVPDDTAFKHSSGSTARP
jgi:hypothetical protein